MKKSPLRPPIPGLIQALRPSPEETEQYSRVIMQYEQRPPDAMSDCQREAELQLWAMRSLDERPRQKSKRHRRRQ